MVEAEIKAQMGEEKLKKIEVGIKDYINVDRKGKQSVEIYEAIEILCSLGDFLEFKKVMIAKRRQANGEAESGSMQMMGSGVIDVAEFMDRLETLKAEAAETDGWVPVLNEGNLGAWSKEIEGGNSLLRCTMKIDNCTPLEAFHMMLYPGDRSEWQPEVKASEILEQYSEDDKLLLWTIKMNFAL